MIKYVQTGVRILLAPLTCSATSRFPGTLAQHRWARPGGLFPAGPKYRDEEGVHVRHEASRETPLGAIPRPG